MPSTREAAYFGLRAQASRVAGEAAADVSSRHAHRQLAQRYQALSDRHARESMTAALVGGVQ